MILNCKVVFLFLCCLVIIRGDAQGDIETKIATLTETVDDLRLLSTELLNRYEKDFQKIASNVLSLVNKDKKRVKVPTLTTAELIYYQTMETGKKALGYYIQLEAIKNGKSKKNVIPIFPKINKEKIIIDKEEEPLYEFLNEMALAIIKNREEAEMETFYKENSIKTVVSTIIDIESKDLRELYKKVLLKLLKEEGNSNKFIDGINYLDESQDVENLLPSLKEGWKEVLLKMTVSEAIDSVEMMHYNSHTEDAYEMLLETSKGDDLLKVIDKIYQQGENSMDSSENHILSKIPYNDVMLEELVKKSKLNFESPKLGAMMIREILNTNPNDPKVLKTALAWRKFRNGNYYLDKTYEKMPQNLLLIVYHNEFCIVNDNRYMYLKYSGKVGVTDKVSERPDKAVWNFFKIDPYTTLDNELCIKNNEVNYHYVGKSEESDELEMKYDNTAWKFNFTDLFTRTKIEQEGKFITIKGNNLVLGDTPTIWDVVKCD